jgi:S-layer homology domain
MRSRVLTRRFTQLALAVVLAAGVSALRPAPADAAVTEALLLPVTPGVTWDVCQGYGNGHSSFSHGGSYSLDLSGAGCAANDTANSVQGQRAYAPWWGTIGYSNADVLCVNVRGGGSMKVGHIARWVTQGQQVTPSTVLGTVNRGGVSFNTSNIPHLHIELYPESGCSEGTGIPFSGAGRMQCAPNMTASGGAGGNGRWSSVNSLVRPADSSFGTSFLDLCNTSSDFRSDIRWLEQEGITEGCASARYCPNGIVSRGQMATFLARFLSLPASSTDYFTDDEDSSHEANINRIARAGITLGCAPSRFCPESPVRRETMAAFLARALDLPATSNDYFTDDEGSDFEADINRIARAGITSGCGGGRFCPTESLERDQMAALLYNARNLR